MTRLVLILLMTLVWSCDSTPTPVAEPSFVPAIDVVDAAPEPEPAQSKKDDANSKKETVKTKPKTKAKPVPKRRQQYKPAIIKIITNFDKADATVNGLPYPEYVGSGDEEGMVVPAGGPYTVIVRYGDKSKTYNLNLRPYETRMLFVELSGYQSGSKSAPVTSKPKETKKKETKKADDKKKDEKKGPGKVTVYSKPPGTIMADGKNLGDKTPGTVELENGRHEIQVEYESGQVSEKKIVRVRDGSRIKLFFRERKK